MSIHSNRMLTNLFGSHLLSRHQLTGVDVTYRRNCQERCALYIIRLRSPRLASFLLLLYFPSFSSRIAMTSSLPHCGRLSSFHFDLAPFHLFLSISAISHTTKNFWAYLKVSFSLVLYSCTTHTSSFGIIKLFQMAIFIVFNRWKLILIISCNYNITVSSIRVALFYLSIVF